MVSLEDKLQRAYEGSRLAPPLKKSHGQFLKRKGYMSEFAGSFPQAEVPVDGAEASQRATSQVLTGWKANVPGMSIMDQWSGHVNLIVLGSCPYRGRGGWPTSHQCSLSALWITWLFGSQVGSEEQRRHCARALIEGTWWNSSVCRCFDLADGLGLTDESGWVCFTPSNIGLSKALQEIF